MAKIDKMCQKSAFLVVPSQNHWKWPTFTTIVQAPWSKKSYFSDFSINIEVLNIDGKIRHIWFFAPGCLNNWGKGWSFSVILAWDNQKGTFLTHFFNFGHEGAPNVTKITYNMKILWENSPRKKNWGSFVHRGLRYEFLRKKIWTVPLILQFNIYVSVHSQSYILPRKPKYPKTFY